jgi:DNA primase
MDALLDPSTDKKVSLLESELEQYVGKRHKYFYQRGFDEHTLSKYEIGFDEVTKSMVIPIRTTEGNIRFLKRRYIETKRFDNAEGINKKDILFGLHYLVKALGKVPELYLTESETDAMACYQEGLPAAAIMGRILFKEQINEMLRAGVEKVNLFYDNDEWGQKAIEKSYELLRNTPIKINVVKYPYHLGIDTLDEEDVNGKDANNLLKLQQFEEIKLISYEEYLMSKLRR